MSVEGLALLEKYFGDFSDQQEKQFAMLGDLYSEWNEKINVISRKDIDSLYEKHVLHSLAIAAVFDLSPAQGLKILDVGTGGGFPGVPLAIMFPNVQFTLVDSIGKKLKVVNAVSDGLQLKNLSTRHTRMEEIKGESFDFVVSRAVAPIKDLWKWSKHLINKDRKVPEFKNGMIFLKGGDLAAEISDSRLRPHTWDIATIYEEPWFVEKYILYVPV